MRKRMISIAMTMAVVTSAFAGCTGAKDTETAQSETNGSVVTEMDAVSDKESVSGNDKETVTSANDADLDGTTITFWHSMGGVNGEALETLVEQFNSDNAYGITVESQYQGEYDDTINKLKSAQIGNMGADLVQIYDIGTRFMIDSGWVIPMQELMENAGFDDSVIEPNIAAYYTINDTLYSMPFNSSTPIMYYNKDMFAAAGIENVPSSLEEIGEMGSQLVEKSDAQEAISLGIYGWFFEQFVCKQGQHYVNNGNGREDIATAVDFDKNGAGLAIVEVWNELSTSGIAPNVGRGADSGLTDFTAGKSAMTLGSTASLKQILQDVNGTFEVGTAYFPSVTAEDKGGVSIGGASLWALNNEDEKKQAATWKFIEYLVSPSSQAYWNAQTGYFPVTTEAANEEIYKTNMATYPQFQTAIDQLHDSAPEYAGAAVSVFPEARQIVETEIENMVNGNQTPEETVTKMAEQINTSIEDYNLVNN